MCREFATHAAALGAHIKTAGLWGAEVVVEELRGDRLSAQVTEGTRPRVPQMRKGCQCALPSTAGYADSVGRNKLAALDEQELAQGGTPVRFVIYRTPGLDGW